MGYDVVIGYYCVDVKQYLCQFVGLYSGGIQQVLEFDFQQQKGEYCKYEEGYFVFDKVVEMGDFFYECIQYIYGVF